MIADDPECRVDANCPPKLACANERCHDPCRTQNPCSVGQQCTVLDSLPTRTVACACPKGFLVDHSGQCKQVIGRPQCYSDPDCRDTEQCHSGNCVRACLVFEGCGTNAECSASNHRATCDCLRGYQGDPYVACYPREYHRILRRTLNFRYICIQ